jgi:hypothetical protein
MRHRCDEENCENNRKNAHALFYRAVWGTAINCARVKRLWGRATFRPIQQLGDMHDGRRIRPAQMLPAADV